MFTTDVTRPTLFTCQVTAIPKVHPCALAEAALTEANIDHDSVVYGKGHPLGLFTKGTRPDVKAATGQEKLPVLVLPGGETIAGSKTIVSWAQANAAARS